MTTGALLSGKLRDLYAVESARIQREFASSGDGRAAVCARAALMDRVILGLWQKLLAPTQVTLLWWVLADMAGRHSFLTLMLICCFCMPTAVVKKSSRKISDHFPRNFGTWA